MSLDTGMVRRIAHLARIKVTDIELDHWTKELNGILGWVEQLQQVDTTGVAPMTSVADITLRTRADMVTDGGYPERVLANAPESTAGFYVVPKVVE
jgi:aspartyl-tRNA(Asn)/glutamyl-tRNA(Gln) amidotransferase subunit C